MSIASIEHRDKVLANQRPALTRKLGFLTRKRGVGLQESHRSACRNRLPERRLGCHNRAAGTAELWHFSSRRDFKGVIHRESQSGTWWAATPSRAGAAEGRLPAAQSAHCRVLPMRLQCRRWPAAARNRNRESFFGQRQAQFALDVRQFRFAGGCSTPTDRLQGCKVHTGCGVVK
jgi:hypothetical protein